VYSDSRFSQRRCDELRAARTCADALVGDQRRENCLPNEENLEADAMQAVGAQRVRVHLR
jgi:hypothetical protein